MTNQNIYEDGMNLLLPEMFNKKEKKEMNDLKETMELMASDDFKDRFKAEYYQLKIRYDKLHKMVVKMEAGTLEFEPKCHIDLFRNQLSAMGNYLYILEVRAEIEGIELK